MALPSNNLSSPRFPGKREASFCPPGLDGGRRITAVALTQTALGNGRLFVSPAERGRSVTAIAVTQRGLWGKRRPVLAQSCSASSQGPSAALRPIGRMPAPPPVRGRGQKEWPPSVLRGAQREWPGLGDRPEAHTLRTGDRGPLIRPPSSESARGRPSGPPFHRLPA